MAEELHRFRITSTWSGTSTGDGFLNGEGYDVAYGLPPAMGGTAGRANPEELLMGAVAACYSLTLAVLAERRRIPLAGIQLTVDGEVERQPGGTLKFKSIRLVPIVTLSGADESQVAIARDLAQKAEQYCPISNAVRGNVEVTVTPEIVNA